MPERFADQRKLVDSFGDHFLVECPRCEACAEVRVVLPEETRRRVTLTCRHCGYAQRLEQSVYGGYLVSRDPASYEPGQIGIGAAVDWYFHCPLWLQTPCRGEVLWAYNAEHMAYIKRYVQADLRERRPGADGWRNASLVSRLPKWMQQAKHREAVLRCLDVLQERLAESSL